MTVELQRRVADDGIVALIVHPGTIITTDLTRYMDGDTMNKLMQMGGATFDPSNVKSVAQGAATTVWAATDASLRAHGGAYLVDCQLAQAGADATDPDTARQLWDLSERLVAAASTDATSTQAF
jgi:hypothetical protein